MKCSFDHANYCVVDNGIGSVEQLMRSLYEAYKPANRCNILPVDGVLIGVIARFCYHEIDCISAVTKSLVT